MCANMTCRSFWVSQRIREAWSPNVQIGLVLQPSVAGRTVREGVVSGRRELGPGQMCHFCEGWGGVSTMSTPPSTRYSLANRSSTRETTKTSVA